MRNLKIENYFPIHFVVIGYGLIVGGFFILFDNWYLSIAFIPVGFFLTSCHHGFSIDLINKTYHEYMSFFMIKTGNPVKYDEIEYGFINSSKNTVTYGPIGMSSTTKYKELNGYLKFSENEKIYIGTGSKSELRESFQYLVGSTLEIKDLTI